MKRQDLLQLALLGMLAAGVISGQELGAQDAVPATPMEQPETCACPAAACKPMTADQQAFYSTLNTEAKLMFIKMDNEGRNLAMKVFQAEPGSNMCAGLNACAQPGRNDCMGKGSCKNTSLKSFTDPNQAVKVTYDKMQAKRQTMQGL